MCKDNQGESQAQLLLINQNNPFTLHNKAEKGEGTRLQGGALIRWGILKEWQC